MIVLVIGWWIVCSRNCSPKPKLMSSEVSETFIYPEIRAKKVVQRAADHFSGWQLWTQARWRKPFLDFKRKSSNVISPILSREPHKVFVYVCINAALLTNPTVSSEVIDNTNTLWQSELGFARFFVFVFSAVSYVQRKELQSFILLLKSDATVLALPSIDRQRKYSLHQFLGTFFTHCSPSDCFCFLAFFFSCLNFAAEAEQWLVHILSTRWPNE